MPRERLCIDIDNVIAQTDRVMRQVIHHHTGGQIDLSYEDIVEFDYYRCQDANGRTISKEQWRDIHDLFSEPHHLMVIEPFPGAQEQLRRLSERFDIHYATSRLPKAWRTTIEWLAEHEFPMRCLHFLTHGEKHACLGGFFAAVEDHYEQAAAFASVKTPCFLIEHPWNKTKPAIPAVHWVKGWEQLAEILLSDGQGAKGGIDERGSCPPTH
jgi:5'(3')-deoxyribonucleotidase